MNILSMLNMLARLTWVICIQGYVYFRLSSPPSSASLSLLTLTQLGSLLFPALFIARIWPSPCYASDGETPRQTALTQQSSSLQSTMARLSSCDPEFYLVHPPRLPHHSQGHSSVPWTRLPCRQNLTKKLSVV